MTWIISIIITLPIEFLLLITDVHIRVVLGGDHNKVIDILFKDDNTILFLVYTLVFSIIVRDIIIIIPEFRWNERVRELSLIPGLDGGDTKEVEPISRRRKWLLFYPSFGAFAVYGLWVMSKS